MVRLPTDIIGLLCFVFNPLNYTEIKKKRARKMREKKTKPWELLAKAFCT